METATNEKKPQVLNLQIPKSESNYSSQGFNKGYLITDFDKIAEESAIIPINSNELRSKIESIRIKTIEASKIPPPQCRNSKILNINYSQVQSKADQTVVNQDTVTSVTAAIEQVRSTIGTNKTVEVKSIVQQFKDDCLSLNIRAMKFLRSNDENKCLSQLKQAEVLLINLDQLAPGLNQTLLGLTLNNFGCYYKKIQKPRVALKYLKMALNIEKRNDEVQVHDLASTYLNLCAIYSELGFFSEALIKATKSILLLKSYIKNKRKSSGESISPKNESELDQVIRQSTSKTSLKYLFAKKMEPKLLKQTKDLRITGENEDGSTLLKLEKGLVIEKSPKTRLKQEIQEKFDLSVVMGIYCAAYYNFGVTLEHLKSYKLSRQAHQKGLNLCQKFLPENLPLIRTFELTIHTIIEKEQNLAQRFINRQINIQSQMTGSQMIGPMKARNQSLRNSFTVTSGQLKLDAPSGKTSRANSKKFHAAAAPITTNQQKISLLGRLVNAENNIQNGIRQQSILNTIEGDSMTKQTQTINSQKLVQQQRQNQDINENLSKKSSLLPVKLRRELESGKLKIQSYDEYIIKQIIKQNKVRLPSRVSRRTIDVPITLPGSPTQMPILDYQQDGQSLAETIQDQRELLMRKKPTSAAATRRPIKFLIDQSQRNNSSQRVQFVNTQHMESENMIRTSHHLLQFEKQIQDRYEEEANQCGEGAILAQSSAYSYSDQLIRRKQGSSTVATTKQTKVTRPFSNKQ